MVLKLEKIHEDFRGSINIIIGDSIKSHRELTILETKSGFARGGTFHSSDEEFIVIEGTVEYHIGNDMYILKKGNHMTIKHGVPHYFKALTDSITMEWGADPQEKNTVNGAYRSIVEEINKHAI